MNTEINIKISQFLDNELNHSEEEALLAKIRQKPELKNKMNRYQAISHMLKTDDFVMVGDSFLDKINHQLKQEPAYFLPQNKIQKSPNYFWQKTSLALAASVACVAVIVSQQTAIQNTGIRQQEVLVTAQQQETAVQNTEKQQDVLVVAKQQQPAKLMVASQATKDSQASQQHERFKAYLQAHSDDLYTHGSFNYRPYAQVASYGQE